MIRRLDEILGQMSARNQCLSLLSTVVGLVDLLAMNACETQARKDQEVTISWVEIFYILYLYLRFRCFGKIQCGLRLFGILWCGFAVFGPPLRPPQYTQTIFIS